MGMTCSKTQSVQSVQKQSVQKHRPFIHPPSPPPSPPPSRIYMDRPSNIRNTRIEKYDNSRYINQNRPKRYDNNYGNDTDFSTGFILRTTIGTNNSSYVRDGGAGGGNSDTGGSYDAGGGGGGGW
jgi:hypothetical protein